VHNVAQYGIQNVVNRFTVAPYFPYGNRPGQAGCPSVTFPGFSGKVFFKLAIHSVIIVGVGGRILLDRNIGPFFGIFGVDLKPLLQSGFGIRFDGVDRALRFTDTAIDAFIRMDDQHVLAFVETVDRAYFDAIGIFASDAVVVDNVCHERLRN
jgi:hypothetical protein